MTLTSHDRWLDVADYDVEMHTIGDIRHLADAVQRTIVGQRDRMPVVAQQRTALGARTDRKSVV